MEMLKRIIFITSSRSFKHASWIHPFIDLKKTKFKLKNSQVAFKGVSAIKFFGKWSHQQRNPTIVYNIAR